MVLRLECFDILSVSTLLYENRLRTSICIFFIFVVVRKCIKINKLYISGVLLTYLRLQIKHLVVCGTVSMVSG